jgi:hypothetical protein
MAENSRTKVSGREFEVRRFSFLHLDEPFDVSWHHWSRVFEYPWLFGRLKELQPSTIHNVAAGHQLGLIREMTTIASYAPFVMHSDLNATDRQVGWDMTIPWPGPQFAAVVCISTLEHVGSAERVSLALTNVLNMVAPKGTALITLDQCAPGTPWGSHCPLEPVVALVGRQPDAPDLARIVTGRTSPTSPMDHDWGSCKVIALEMCQLG